MKKLSLFILLVLFHCTLLFAQKKKFVTVSAGENIMDILSPGEVFYYPVFTGGKVFRRDGTKAEAEMNYNRLVDEIHFIGAKGDTLALAEEATIRYVAIEKDTFYYDNGYVRLLSTGGKAKLAFKQVWVISNTRQLGAYNSTNSSVSITSFTSYGEGGRLYDLTVNADVVLSRVEQFYLGNNDGHFVSANKKNLMLLFPKDQRLIETYLKENKIDYNSEEDLTRLIQFLANL
jgi:hypothetical protein